MRCRDIDILMVDDIQFPENKEGTPEEFFYIFNTLHNASKQIVGCGGRPPKVQLNTLEGRLCHRFNCDVNASPEALEFITSKIYTNICRSNSPICRCRRSGSSSATGSGVPGVFGQLTEPQG